MIRSQRNTVVLLGICDDEEVKRSLRLGLLYRVYLEDSFELFEDGDDIF